MSVRRDVLLLVAGLAISLLGVNQSVQAGDCGYGHGSLPVPSCYASPTAVQYHYHCCNQYSCCKSRDRGSRDRGATRDVQTDYRATAPVPIVSSMPVFSTPMMMASVPVMPTMANRAAQPNTRSASSDCHARIDRLEENVNQLAEAMRELQLLVHDQTRALDNIANRVKHLPLKEDD